MVNHELEAILKQAIGLKLTSIGQTTLERVLNRRREALGVKSFDDYLTRLKSSPYELKALIEDVVIPETWFFRDGESYSSLTRFLRERLKPTGNSLLRILSIPCSTGEEPYSIVITVLQAGWPQHLFRVDAVDISARSIDFAKRAEYGNNSFRGENLEFRKNYFQKTGNVYQLREVIRRQVHFFCGNILNRIFMEAMGAYDVIFCRNVLIYLDAEAQARAMYNLDRALMPNGLLFIGHSEAGLFTTGPFVHSPYHKAFVFTKPQESGTDKSAPALNEQNIKKCPGVHVIDGRPSRPPQATPATGETIEDPLARARRLADQGRLDESSRLCKEHLQLHGPSAEAFFLLGLMHDIRGEQDEAAKLLRKAVYLKPDFQDALILLALIAERRGDGITANNYRRRAQRLLDN